MFFSRSTPSEKAKDNRGLIASNSASVEALIVLAKNNNDLIATLKEMQEQLKYLIPSDNPKVVDCDNKIKDKIDDLRTELAKSDGAVNKKVEDLVADIKVTMVERKSRLERATTE